MSGKKENIHKNSLDTDVPPTFYDKIEENVILDLTKLSDLVIERYKLLKIIESRSQKERSQKEGNPSIIYNLTQSFQWNDNKENINNDISSHFLLALIMCKNETDIKWFIRQESKLFKERIDIQKNIICIKYFLN